MRKSPRQVECCAALGPGSQGETAFSPARLLIRHTRKSNRNSYRAQLKTSFSDRSRRFSAINSLTPRNPGITNSCGPGTFVRKLMWALPRCERGLLPGRDDAHFSSATPSTKTPRRTGAFDAETEFVKALRALRIDLGVVALGVPFIDDIVDLLDVALGVELHLADHRIPLTGLDRIHDFLRIGGAGFRDRLRPDLHRGVGVERVAFGIDVLGLEPLDDGLGGRLVARVGSEGEQGAFAGGPRDRRELLVGQRVASHQNGLKTLVAHLTHQQSGFLMVAAYVDEVDVVALQARHDGVKILVALVVGLEHLFGEPDLVERLLGLVGEAFAVGRLVVEDGDVLAFVELRDVTS